MGLVILVTRSEPAHNPCATRCSSPRPGSARRRGGGSLVPPPIPRLILLASHPARACFDRRLLALLPPVKSFNSRMKSDYIVRLERIFEDPRETRFRHFNACSWIADDSWRRFKKIFKKSLISFFWNYNIFSLSYTVDGSQLQVASANSACVRNGICIDV